MPPIIQNLIVLLAVTGCGLVLLRHAFGAFTGKRSKLGNCCAKGCSCSAASDLDASSVAKPQTVFIPVDSLRACCRQK